MLVFFPPPLCNILVIVSWDGSSQYMESHKSHIPNHQPDYVISSWCISTWTHRNHISRSKSSESYANPQESRSRSNGNFAPQLTTQIHIHWIGFLKIWTGNHRFSHEIGSLNDVPSGKLNYGKIHHFQWVNPGTKWPCSISMFLYQRLNLPHPTKPLIHCPTWSHDQLQSHDGSLALHDGAVMASADLPLPQAPPAPQPFPALDLPLPPPLPGTK